MADSVRIAWVYALSLFACAQAALLGLQDSIGPAFFLPQRVRFFFPFPSCFIILCLSVGTSLRIRKDMTITHRSRIRRRAHWATARFAWTRSSVRRKIRLENRDDAAQETAHRIVWRPVRIYSYVSPSSGSVRNYSFNFYFFSCALL